MKQQATHEEQLQFLRKIEGWVAGIQQSSIFLATLIVE